jgi:hypothetical protein
MQSVSPWSEVQLLWMSLEDIHLCAGYVNNMKSEGDAPENQEF